jgi:hypothetical protein
MLTQNVVIKGIPKLVICFRLIRQFFIELSCLLFSAIGDNSIVSDSSLPDILGLYY